MKFLSNLNEDGFKYASQRLNQFILENTRDGIFKDGCENFLEYSKINAMDYMENASIISQERGFIKY